MLSFIIVKRNIIKFILLIFLKNIRILEILLKNFVNFIILKNFINFVQKKINFIKLIK